MKTITAPEIARALGVSRPDRLMTVSEVAELLQMSTAWVRQHANGVRQPTIPSIKLGKSVRFRRSSVQEFVDSMERAA